MKWNGDTATAVAIVTAGWQTEDERIVFQAAYQHIKNVARLEYALALQKATCPTCGHYSPTSAKNE